MGTSQRCFHQYQFSHALHFKFDSALHKTESVAWLSSPCEAAVSAVAGNRSIRAGNLWRGADTAVARSVMLPAGIDAHESGRRPPR
jgi:hypothetical protein